MRVKHLRDIEGNFYDSYLGENGRYYTPENIFDEDGNLQEDFEIYEMDEDEVEENKIKSEQLNIENNLADLRKTRNKLLSESDWVVTKSLESGESVPSEWVNYRQALRDITNTYSNLDDAVFPEKPE